VASQPHCLKQRSWRATYLEDTSEGEDQTARCTDEEYSSNIQSKRHAGIRQHDQWANSHELPKRRQALSEGEEARVDDRADLYGVSQAFLIWGRWTYRSVEVQ
jgi:hypothetical protein